jgi:hypothetical protein
MMAVQSSKAEEPLPKLLAGTIQPRDCQIAANSDPLFASKNDPSDTTPSYLVRDNDGAYGQTFKDRVQAMGSRDRPISPRSPWQNPYVERLIGTLRRDCLDHVLIFGERHLRRLLTSYYSVYYITRSIIMKRARIWGWARTRR